MEKIKSIGNIIKFSIIIVVVFIVEYGTNCIESKVENVNLNRTLDLSAMTEIDWDSTDYNNYPSLGQRVGSLTGYAADCPLCSGFLGCSPYLDVRDKTTIYSDKEYGNIRIVAASKSNLKCGSIIRFNSDRVSESTVTAIVLDRGVSGNAIDLLTESEEYASQNIGRSTITYEVVRDGWISE